MAHVESLNATDIEFGRSVWRVLRGQNKFPAVGVFWLFKPKSDEWHLIVASSKADEIPLTQAYRELEEITKHIAADFEQSLRVEIISPNVPLYQALRSVFGQTASVDGVRLGNTQLGGMYIEDAYLYGIK